MPIKSLGVLELHPVIDDTMKCCLAAVICHQCSACMDKISIQGMSNSLSNWICFHPVISPVLMKKLMTVPFLLLFHVPNFPEVIDKGWPLTIKELHKIILKRLHFMKYLRVGAGIFNVIVCLPESIQQKPALTDGINIHTEGSENSPLVIG